MVVRYVAAQSHGRLLQKCPLELVRISRVVRVMVVSRSGIRPINLEHSTSFIVAMATKKDPPMTNSNEHNSNASVGRSGSKGFALTEENVAILKNAVLHGGRVSFRGAVLGYFLRGGIDFLLRLLRILRGKVSVVKVIKETFGASDALRTAWFFGSFSFLWKAIYDVATQLGQLTTGKAGFTAGVLAGLSIVFERKERRIGIAEQVIVRGLNVGWSILKNANRISFPVRLAAELERVIGGGLNLAPLLLAFSSSTKATPSSLSFAARKSCFPMSDTRKFFLQLSIHLSEIRGRSRRLCSRSSGATSTAKLCPPTRSNFCKSTNQRRSQPNQSKPLREKPSNLSIAALCILMKTVAIGKD